LITRISDTPNRNRAIDEHGLDIWVGEVDRNMIQSGARSAQGVEDSIQDGRVSAPGLFGVVRRPEVQHHVCAVGEESGGDGTTDADAAAGAGHKRRDRRVTGAVYVIMSLIGSRSWRGSSWTTRLVPPLTWVLASTSTCATWPATGARSASFPPAATYN
jgi:hypothetical protein